MKRRVFLLMTLALIGHIYQVAAQSIYTPYTFTTIAGLAGNGGTNDGTGSNARLLYPSDVAVDNAGNVYVADDSTIRKVSPEGTNWVVTTIAGLAENYGTNDGIGSAARFDWLGHLAVDNSGNIYVADTGNETIRKVSPEGTNWVVTTIAGLPGVYGSADGTGSDARFDFPMGLAVDNTGNLYVVEDDNSTIRKVTPVGTNWVVTTIAGLPGIFGTNDGVGADARFWFPRGVTVDSSGNIYVADSVNSTIRKVSPVGTNWVVTTIAGSPLNPGTNDGIGSEARFSYYVPGGLEDVAVDATGNLYVADKGNHTIRKLTPVGTNWVVTTLAGLPLSPGHNDGTGSAAGFAAPQGVAVDGAGNVYVAEVWGPTIRKGHPQNVPAVIATSPPGLGFNADQFSFVLSGPTGQTVVVEVSTDLVNWLPIWTNTFAGDLNFSDPQSECVRPSLLPGAHAVKGAVLRS